MMLPTIRVIGSLNIDFTTLTPRFPSAGETLTAKSLSINAGGKGANQAVACGRASFISKGERDVQVEMVGAVGAHDPYYQTLLKPTLEEAGLDCSGVKEMEGCQTGTATIIVDEGMGGENRILVVPGANHDGMRDGLEVMQRISKAPSPDVIVLQGEIPKETVFATFEHFGNLGKNARPEIVFNPAPVFDEGISRENLGLVDVLIMNEGELEQVVLAAGGFATPGEEEKETVYMGRVAKELHELGIGIVIVTLGAGGVYYSTSVGESNLVPGIRVKQVVDTTAAGDTFVGHFTTALARWKGRTKRQQTNDDQIFHAEAAIQKANQAAAQCVQKSGAMQSIPWGYEV